MTAEELALQIRNRIQPLLTPALEATLPGVYNDLKQILDTCSEIYTDQYINRQTEKECCG